MKVIFCQDPVTEQDPDSMYIDEVAAANRAGLDFALVDYSALTDRHNAARAVRDVPVYNTMQSAIYRGWSLTVAQYAALYDALLSRGVRLINNATQYKHTQYLPETLSLIKGHTPRTIWMETNKDVSHEAILQALLPFAGRPLFLRDFVASEKRYWQQACYISSASDKRAVENTVNKFLKLRGNHFTGGLIFREFVEFEPLSEVASGKMPLIDEYRIFYVNHLPVQTVHYWDLPDHEPTVVPLDQFADVVKSIRSRFFTMDVARRPDGKWMIIDFGDAQTAQLPENADEHVLYRALAGAK